MAPEWIGAMFVLLMAHAKTSRYDENVNSYCCLLVVVVVVAALAPLFFYVLLFCHTFANRIALCIGSPY